MPAMPTITFIFLEASIEPIPKSIINHPIILKDSKRRKRPPSEILLDDSKHHAAMKDLENCRKRGRPDIIHFCLLSVFDSQLGELSDVYVHTIDGKIIKFSKGLRLPRNYNRFVGLMEQLLKERKIESGGKTLIEIKDYDLKSTLRSIDPSQTLFLTEKGRKIDDLKINVNSRNAILIGAFPHGDFDHKVLEVIKNFNPVYVSLGSKSFTSLYVTNRVICLLEDLFDIT
jgi:rRNA small subunit pseudouridine methyltransferase Nep1